ncbi:MAG: histidinol-phosphate transaminase [Pseudomonadota bacterium]
MSVLDLVRPALAELTPYKAAEQVFDTVRLNANESPFDTASADYRRPLNRYPEIRPQRLRALLAERFGCATDRLLVTRGSSEAIDLLIRAFCTAEQDNIVVTSPTFSMYAHYARVQGADVRDVPLLAADDFALDESALQGVIDQRSKLLFLCSPNNPTGTSLPRATIERVLERTRGRLAVVVDEAYIEFSDAASVATLLDRYEHLIVLRTLSKALAFAGARCGAVIANAALVGVLDAIQAPYALSTPVVECVEDALSGDNIERAEQQVSLLVSERERVRAELESMSIIARLWPSDANFLLVEFTDVHKVLEATRNAGVLLRYFGDALDACARISIGTAAENDAMLEAVRSTETRA